MWFLKSLKDSSICYGLISGKEYAVGRKQTDIVILNDPSISRKHAVLQVSHREINVVNPEMLPILTISDAKSKYGTYVNTDTKIQPISTLLKSGDIVTFGQCGSSFRVCYEPLVATTSCVDIEEKSSLKKLILQLGGHLVSEWRTDCTHLVMKGVKVTTKAVCAMVSLKPIVKPEFFTQLLNSWKSQTDIPDSSKYIPPIDEKCLNEEVSFDIHPKRKTIFEGKTFILLSRSQYKKLHLMISLAGGKVVLLSDDQNVTEDILLHPDTCVMAVQNNMTDQSQESEIAQLLKRNKKRMIPEYDIGLAVVYCSTEKHCNSYAEIVSPLFGGIKIISQTFSQQEVYAEDTQMSHFSCEESSNLKNPAILPSVESSENKQIDSSCLDTQNWNIQTLKNPFTEVDSNIKAVKRERCSSGDIIPEAKHVKLEPAVPSVIQLDSEDRKMQTEFDNLATLNVVIKQENVSTDLKITKEINMENVTCQSSTLSEDLTLNQKESLKLKNHNGNCLENQYPLDDDLPRNLLLIEFAPLICKKSLSVKKQINTSKESSIKNFKRFKKVQLNRSVFLPCIIGGRDLEIYTKKCTKAIDEWLNEHPDSQTQESETSIFDWNAESKKRKR